MYELRRSSVCGLRSSLDLHHHNCQIVMRLFVTDKGGYLGLQMGQHGLGAGRRADGDSLFQPFEAKHLPGSIVGFNHTVAGQDN